MVYPLIRPWLFAISTFFIPCLAGCAGTLGADDVEPGSCAIGPTPPFQSQVIPSKDSTAREKIYLLHGLENTFSLGLDALAIEMRGLNFDPAIVDWPTWETAAQQIVSTYTVPNDGSECVLIGHSYGADDAVRMARVLHDHGIQVRLLFLLDATSPDPIPDNVDLCVHYYETWLPGDLFPAFFSGNPVVAAPDNSHTQIRNLLFTREALGDGVGCADHFSIDANELMHNIIIEEVLKLIAAPSGTGRSNEPLLTQIASPQKPETR